jgi:hypothetical protein
MSTDWLALFRASAESPRASFSPAPVAGAGAGCWPASQPGKRCARYWSTWACPGSRRGYSPGPWGSPDRVVLSAQPLSLRGTRQLPPAARYASPGTGVPRGGCKLGACCQWHPASRLPHSDSGWGTAQEGALGCPAASASTGRRREAATRVPSEFAWLAAAGSPRGVRRQGAARIPPHRELEQRAPPISWPTVCQPARCTHRYPRCGCAWIEPCRATGSYWRCEHRFVRW